MHISRETKTDIDRRNANATHTKWNDSIKKLFFFSFIYREEKHRSNDRKRRKKSIKVYIVAIETSNNNQRFNYQHMYAITQRNRNTCISVGWTVMHLRHRTTFNWYVQRGLDMKLIATAVTISTFCSFVKCQNKTRIDRCLCCCCFLFGAHTFIHSFTHQPETRWLSIVLLVVLNVIGIFDSTDGISEINQSFEE